jgi:hypothetical protein
MPGFQGLNEFVRIGKDLRSGYGEFLPQGIRNPIEGILLLQQFPDSESDWIETETDALFNIQKHRPIFGNSLPNTGCDREVRDSCWIAHVVALRLSLLPRHDSGRLQTAAKTIFAA